ncbi:ABC transporter ATP-binding protein [Rhizobium beringeri]
MLRLIAGVINPTSGTIETRGKIAPMLALGAGFEPSLSGSQNIYLNMSLLGMTTKEISARYDEVVDFAEIGESIDAPLGTYSTGMRMRLGFACAVHTDPQLLIVDEVLAVGDANFHVKCRNKINDIRRGGASLPSRVPLQAFNRVPDRSSNLSAKRPGGDRGRCKVRSRCL